MRIDQWDDDRLGAGISVVVDEHEAAWLIAQLAAQLAQLRLVLSGGAYAEAGNLKSTDGLMLSFSVLPHAAHTMPGEDLK